MGNSVELDEERPGPLVASSFVVNASDAGGVQVFPEQGDDAVLLVVDGDFLP